AVEAEQHDVLAFVRRRLRQHLRHELNPLAADAGEDDLAFAQLAHACANSAARPAMRCFTMAAKTSSRSRVSMCGICAATSAISSASSVPCPSATFSACM